MTSAKLGDICTIVTGGTPSRSKSEYWSDGIIPWIKISDIKGKYVNKTDESITELGLEKSSAKLLRKGTILYTIFATLGEVGILNIDACTNQAIAGITINKNNNVTTNYLYYYMKSKKEYVNNIGRGVAQNNINLSILRQFEVPIPSAEEQRKIVSTLDKLQSIITHLRTQLEKLDLLVKARFVEMFGDPVENPMNWESKTISEVAPPKPYEGILEETVWLLNLDMVESQTGRIINYLYVDKSKVGNSTCAFDERNVLYSKLRPYLNKVVVPNKKGYATTELVPLRPNQLLNREFFASLLRSDSFVSYINDKVAGAKMPRVSMQVFREFKCILPPIELQTQFADFVKQVDKSRFVT